MHQKQTLDGLTLNMVFISRMRQVFFSYFDKCEAQVKISKQEAHGAQRSNKNQFKSMNTGTFERSYDYIYYKTGPVVQEEEIL